MAIVTVQRNAEVSGTTCTRDQEGSQAVAEADPLSRSELASPVLPVGATDLGKPFDSGGRAECRALARLADAWLADAQTRGWQTRGRAARSDDLELGLGCV